MFLNTYKQEEDSLERLEVQLRGVQTAEEKLRYLNDIGKITYASDAVRTLAIGEEAESLAVALGDTDGRFHALANQAFAQIIRSNFDAARATVKMLERLLSPEQPTQQCRLYRLQAILQQRSCNLQDALVLAMSAVNVFKDAANTDPLELGLAHNTVANILVYLADTAGAIDHYTQSITLLEPLGYRDLVARLINNLGMAHRELGEYGNAIYRFKESLQRIPATRPDYMYAVILGNLSLSLIEASRASEAIEPLQQALSICETIDAKRGIGTMHHNLGLARHQLGDYEMAEKHFQQSLEARRACQELLDVAEGQVRYASLLVDMGRRKEAEVLLYETLQAPHSNSWKKLRADVHHALFLLYQKEKNFEAALTQHIAYHDTYESLRNERAEQRYQALLIRLKTRELTQEKEQAKQQSLALERLSLTDELTGLPNRRSLEQGLAQALQGATQHGQGFSIALVDVDHFKQVNDRFSHLVGDSVLRAVGQILSTNLRAGDLLGRYGGEEFMLIFYNTSLEIATKTCERLRQALQKYTWDKIHSELQITASFGLAAYHTGASKAELLASADAALYQAKHNGRNRVESRGIS